MNQWQHIPTEFSHNSWYWIRPCQADWIEGFSSAQIVLVSKSQDARERMLYSTHRVRGINGDLYLGSLKQHLWYGPIEAPEVGNAE
jgi:hypothetical protein